MNKSLALVKNNIQSIVSKFLNNQTPIVQGLILIGLCVAVLTFFFLLARTILRHKDWFYRLTKTELLGDLMAQTLAFLLKAIGVVFVLYIIGAESIVAFVLGTAGVLGLGISFAFKDIIENYIAGIILSIRQPFKKNDLIIVDGHEGIVQRMTTRMTMIKSLDGNNVSIPNATIFKTNITNYSVVPERRFKFSLGINPDADPNFARKVGLQVLNNIESILKKPSPSAVIDSIGDSSIVLNYFAWMNQDVHDFLQIRSIAISAVKDAIEKEGVEIPDPSYIIKLKNLEDNKKSAKKSSISFDDIEHLISPTRRESDAVKEQIENEGGSSDLLSEKSKSE